MASDKMAQSEKDLSWFVPRSHPDPLCRVVLVEPLIPENTGNVSRTCVGTDSELHLVEPMGFELTASRVQRAGLDYWKDLAWSQHRSYAEWQKTMISPAKQERVFLIETGGTKTIYDVAFQRGDWIVFGKETSGLDQAILKADDAPTILSIPMPGTTRSLNLSNAVAIVVFEILRQTRL
jgi:tRNA (cytidine/uridine-2'-O-)-methyltransferase